MELRRLALVTAIVALTGCADACSDTINNEMANGETNGATNGSTNGETNGSPGTNNDQEGLQVEALESGGYGVLLRTKSDESGLEALVLDFVNGELMYQTPDEYVVGAGAVSADGSRLVFSGRIPGESPDTYRVELPDGTPEPLGLPDEGATPLLSVLQSMSADGTRVIYFCTAADASTDGICLWEEGSGTANADPDEVLGSVDRAVLSDDGETIVALQSSNVLRMAVGGDTVTEVYDADNPPGDGFPDDTGTGTLRTSADGSVVALSGNDTEGGTRAIGVFADTDASVTFDVSTGAAGFGIDLSPDGQRVAFNDEGTLKWFEVGDEQNIRVVGEEQIFGWPEWTGAEAIAHYVVDDETKNFEIRYTPIGGETRVIASGPNGSEDIIGNLYEMRQ